MAAQNEDACYDPKDDTIMLAVVMLLMVYAATGLEMLLFTFLFLM